MAKKWLMDIPLELRLMVYERYFRSIRIRLHWLPGDAGVSRCDSNCADRMLPRLLRVARQVKSEAYPIFFAQAVFKISECCCWWDSFHKYRIKPLTFDRVQNISFALHEADFLRRFVLPSRYFKSICLKDHRELISTRVDGKVRPDFGRLADLERRHPAREEIHQDLHPLHSTSRIRYTIQTDKRKVLQCSCYDQTQLKSCIGVHCSQPLYKIG